MVYDTYSLLNANADTVADDIIATFNSKVCPHQGDLSPRSYGGGEGVKERGREGVRERERGREGEKVY